MICNLTPGLPDTRLIQSEHVVSRPTDNFETIFSP